MRLLSEIKNKDVVVLPENVYPPIIDDDQCHSSKPHQPNFKLLFAGIYIVLVCIISYWIYVMAFHGFGFSKPFTTSTINRPIEFESTTTIENTSSTPELYSLSTQASTMTGFESSGNSNSSLTTTVIDHPATTVIGHPATTVIGHPATTVIGPSSTTVTGLPSASETTEETQTDNNTPILSSTTTELIETTSDDTTEEVEGQSNSVFTEGSSSTTIMSQPSTTRPPLNPVNDNPVSFINEKYQNLAKYNITQVCTSPNIYFAVLKIRFIDNMWNGKGNTSKNAKHQSAYEAMKELFPDDLDEVLYNEVDYNVTCDAPIKTIVNDS